MLETLRLAATAYGLSAAITRREAAPDTRPVFDVRLDTGGGTRPSPLVAAIKTRSVQRRPLSMRPLTADEKSALSASLPASYSLVWVEGLAARWRIARPVCSAHIRLTMPEAFRRIAV
jgi:hypothetical protein